MTFIHWFFIGLVVYAAWFYYHVAIWLLDAYRDYKRKQFKPQEPQRPHEAPARSEQSSDRSAKYDPVTGSYEWIIRK